MPWLMMPHVMASRFRDPNRRKRIDTRNQNDPAVQAGMRNIHRDTRGNVIGGVTAEGQAIGTKSSQFRRAGGSRLRNPSTPSLDRLASMQSKSPSPSFAEQEKTARQKSAMAGNFGTGAQKRAENLSGRNQLYADLQGAGGNATPEMHSRADDLGVTGSRFRQVAGKVKNRTKRKKLYKDMEANPSAVAGVKPGSRFRERAMALGVTDEEWLRARKKLEIS